MKSDLGKTEETELAPESQPKPISIGKNAFWNSLGSLTYQGCLWLTTVLVVLLSDGYADSGVLALAMTVGNMYDPIATYNMRVYQASDTTDTHRQSQYIGFRIVTMIIGFCIITPYCIAVAQEPGVFASLIAFVFFKANEAFCDVLYGVDQHYQRMDYIGISQLIRGIGVLACFSGGIWLSGNLTVAIIAMFAFCVGVTVVYDIPRSRRLDSIRPRIDKAVVLDLLKTCLPIALATLMLSMIVSVARQCFSFLYDVNELGIYAAIATPAVLVQALARYLYSPVLVPLAESWNSGDIDGFTQRFRKTVVAMAAIVVAAIVVLSAIGSPALVLIYGESIAEHTYIFPFVLVCVSLIAFIWLFSDVLTVIRDLKSILLADAVGLATCLAVMVPLETAFGMNGINFTIIAAMTLGALVAIVCVIRQINKKRLSRHLS